MVSDKKIFPVFPYISLCKICDPRGEAVFWIKGHNLNKLVKGPLGDATYQISRLYALWVFPYIRLCKTCDPGAGPFLALGA